ncbi:MAG: hypothetical protein AABN34_10450 [Acidobacteriota bacterium]
MRARTWINPIAVILIALLLGIVVGWHTTPPSIWAQSSPPSVEKDKEELARLFREDQADRTSKDGKPIDWKAVDARDKTREKRVKELYANNQLRTGADYYHVAMVLQHASAPEDYLLAHELCVVAISKGDERAKWLAAASEDRFLMELGRPQRFATQFRSVGNSPMRLYQTDQGVTDGLRMALNVPTLAQAKEREARMNSKKN